MSMGYPKKWKIERFQRPAPAPLKFGADGKFKILHITDIHDVEPIMDDDENREIPDNKDKETINVIESNAFTDCGSLKELVLKYTKVMDYQKL